ncbi:hypothetical protein M514_01452 [Trichuris suis]|uniref:Uncharacterized protein n=1 Tax=Trichuris suis TaxID=68888 RepID=A0A085N7P7_9BILA|nr:hypothetical protein M514_01452 [Trichuris suis]
MLGLRYKCSGGQGDVRNDHKFSPSPYNHVTIQPRGVLSYFRSPDSLKFKEIYNPCQRLLKRRNANLKSHVAMPNVGKTSDRTNVQLVNWEANVGYRTKEKYDRFPAIIPYAAELLNIAKPTLQLQML